MLLLPISIALCLLTMPLARGAVALERQVEESPSSATKTVTKIVVITSTATPPPTPTTSRFFVTYTHSGQISVSTATVTLLPVVPTSTLHGSASPSSSSVTSSSGDSDSRSKGAIAGGVLGALAAIVAIFAAFICYRRRSPKHWRNRAVGRWHVTDSKDAGAAGSRAIYVGEPMYKFQDNTKQSDLEPLPPLYIRDRQPTADPFNDPPDSPSSHRAHTRSVSASSAAYQKPDSPGNLHIELQPRLR